MSEELIPEETIKYTKSYNATDNMLVETSTPDKIVAQVKTYNITEVRNELERINAIIELWTAKKEAQETIISEYEKLNPVKEETVEEIITKE